MHKNSRQPRLQSMPVPLVAAHLVLRAGVSAITNGVWEEGKGHEEDAPLTIAISRRQVLAGSGAALLASRAGAAPAFAPTWESLAGGYRVPEWFRDAKFGIWAHWGPQCQPELGDWYARLMYIQGPAVAHGETLRRSSQAYGHPSRTGFIDIIGQWKAEHWQPEELLSRYVKAGARYFIAMGCHHDNFDLFASRITAGTRRASGRSATSSAPGSRWSARPGSSSAFRTIEPCLALVPARLRL